MIELKSGSSDITSTVISGLRLPIRALFDAGENLATMKILIGK